VGEAGLTAPGVEPDEQRLVAAAQRDPACFGELYERHFVRVYAYVSRRVASRDAAEDVTSEVFHRALAGIGEPRLIAFQASSAPRAAQQAAKCQAPGPSSAARSRTSDASANLPES